MTGPAQTADDRDAEQVREWNTYVAVVAIDYYGTRAYNAGDKVPASAVQGDAAWVAEAWVRSADETAPHVGSQTAPPAEPPKIDTAVAVSPAASTPVPPPDSPTAAPPPDTPAAVPGADTPTES